MILNICVNRVQKTAKELTSHAVRRRQKKEDTRKEHLPFM